MEFISNIKETQSGSVWLHWEEFKARALSQ